MGRYLDMIATAEVPQTPAKMWARQYAENAENAVSRIKAFNAFTACRVHSSERLDRALHILDRRSPDYVEHNRWRQAVADGRRFLTTWGAQALALGWTVRDLFGLHSPPENPHPTYRRLSRYDETGLIWLLEGCEVLALTATTATIRTPSGSTTTYRRSNTPAPSAPGDSLDEFQ